MHQFYFLAVALSAVAPSLAMVHKHSPAARAARRLRASELGFLTSKPPDAQHVQVSREIAPRVKAVAKSLSIHRGHCTLLKKSVHFAASAAVAARQHITEAEFSAAKFAHKRRNVAMHDFWADIDDDDVDSCGPVESSWPSGDQLFDEDPWRNPSPAPAAPRGDLHPVARNRSPSFT